MTAAYRLFNNTVVENTEACSNCRLFAPIYEQIPTIVMQFGFIKRRMDLLTGFFFNGKGSGKFRSKEFGCIKRLDLLSGFYCISFTQTRFA